MCLFTTRRTSNILEKIKWIELFSNTLKDIENLFFKELKEKKNARKRTMSEIKELCAYTGNGCVHKQSSMQSRIFRSVKI